MGIRVKQLNISELYSELDARYGSVGKNLDVNISADTEWEVYNSSENVKYYRLRVDINDEGINKDSRLIIQSKYNITKTYDDNLENENTFSHIVKVTPGENFITFYSDIDLKNSSLNVSVLLFN